MKEAQLLKVSETFQIEKELKLKNLIIYEWGTLVNKRE